LTVILDTGGTSEALSFSFQGVQPFRREVGRGVAGMDVLVVGGGVIGVCSAYYLACLGCGVTLVEQGSVGDACSYGNAGLLVPSHSVPLAAPGIPLKALKWMLNPESPFYIKPRLSWNLLRWLWSFARACTPRRATKAIPIIRDLSLASFGLYRELAGLEGLEFGFHADGALMLFRTEEGYREGLQEARLLAQWGLRTEILDGQSAHRLEPSLLPDLVGAVFYRDDGHVTPWLFVRGLASVAECKGARILKATQVFGFRTSGRRIVAVETTKGTFEADVIVLAAGSWTPQLASQLHLQIPIQAAKGYSLTYEQPGFPKIPLLLAEAKVGVTPMGKWLRFAGTLELGGLDSSIERRRVEAIRVGVRHYITGTDDLKLVEIWRGLRPCTPDGLPIIGWSGRFENLIIATGHAMLGISLGPITGKLVSQLASHEEPSVDLSLLSPERF
jgi:D-amino-acid dehydrogenase